MKIYFDNCTLNRQFDDQLSMLVKIEIMTILAIQEMVKSGEIELLWSDILDYENNNNPHEKRRTQIAEWESHSFEKVKFNDEIEEMAGKYMKIGLKKMDALHVASAVFGKCDYFITVDKKILNKNIKETTVINPVTFLWRLQNDD